MNPESIEDILGLIAHISPQARDYAERAVRDNKLAVIYHKHSEYEHGVFCIAEDDQCVIAYFAFIQEADSDVLLDLIANTMTPYLQQQTGTQELCFNLYGENTQAIHFVRQLGFQTDMEGYHLYYDGPHEPDISNTGLIINTYDASMLTPLADLFDRAYNALNQENGWPLDQHRINIRLFHERLEDKVRNDEFRSFWKDGNLIGAYIISGEYIQDIVVAPDQQNRGYGSTILTHCIRQMASRKIPRIYLRIAKSNQGARRLYERHHFKEAASFAEHTWRAI
ncbi:N-acetyltransferase [Paenibacillus sp. XY044]|uniref:GNAT family N-acetyltransferase n=1 Tax=Paenibacillus sp. XY044 TaxID=2026089 RepID=UPI0015C597D0|nr:GNAT family N-acetyltransferase [Paenibacillus sp. XY044]